MLQNRENPFTGNSFLISANRTAKGEKKWLGGGIIVGRFGDKYDLVLFRGSYLDVDIDDMRSTNSLLVTVGRDGALQLHVASAKFPIHYMADSQSLTFLPKMRNGILNPNQTTWPNTDTRLTPELFYEPTLNREIDIRDMGGVNDFMRRLGEMGDLKHEKGAKEAIVELKSLIHGHRMGRNSAGNSEIPGSYPIALRKR